MKQHVIQFRMNGTGMGEERPIYQKNERHIENNVKVGTNAQVPIPLCSESKISLHVYAMHFQEAQAMNQCRRFRNF